jgi:hypothetical protein
MSTERTGVDHPTVVPDEHDAPLAGVGTDHLTVVPANLEAVDSERSDAADPEDPETDDAGSPGTGAGDRTEVDRGAPWPTTARTAGARNEPS